MSSTAITICLFIEDITSSNNPVQCCLVSCPSSIVFIRNNAAALSEGLIEAPLVLLLSGSINPHACKGKGICYFMYMHLQFSGVHCFNVTGNMHVLRLKTKEIMFSLEVGLV